MWCQEEIPQKHDDINSSFFSWPIQILLLPFYNPILKRFMFHYLSKAWFLTTIFQEWMTQKIQQSLFWNCISIKQADDEVVKMEVFALPKCDYWFDVKFVVKKKFHKNLMTLILLYLANINPPTFLQSNTKDVHISLHIKSMFLINNFSRADETKDPTKFVLKLQQHQASWWWSCQNGSICPSKMWLLIWRKMWCQ